MDYRVGRTIKIYYRFSRHYAWVVGALTVSIVGTQLLSLAVPLQYKLFFDTLAEGPNAAGIDTLWHILLTIGILYACEWVWRRILFAVSNKYQTSVVADLTNYCFQYLHRHSFAYFTNNFVGALVKRVGRFVGAFERVTDRVFWNVLPLLVNIVVILAVLGSRSIWLGLVVLAWIIIFTGVNFIVTLHKLKYDVQRSEAETKASGLLADTITNSNNVKLFNGYERESNSFGAATDKVRRLRWFTMELDSWFETIQGFFTYALELGMIALAIYLWRRGTLTLGDFVMMQAYLLALFWRIWDFGRIIRHTFEDLADAEEMTEVLETPHEIQDIPTAKPLVVTAGTVEFRNVAFHYHQTRPILRDFNLAIASGERVALVGPSGAGKSTIVKLLLRQHDIGSGKILIDGVDVRKVTQESLWAAVSYVPQEPVLFHRTLLENIRYGRPEATDEQVMVAATRARCHEFIDELPDKYHTFVGERGIKLSGGERQRVAIARAILRNAPILVLDEATSSLDSESEHLIQAALDELMAGKTVIVIAHRLSTIMRMDWIVVMDHGAVVESGTHAKLLVRPKGLYRELWKLQAGGFLVEDEADLTV